MDFAGMNYLAVVAAAVAGFLVRWPWYMAFSRPWIRATGQDPDKPRHPEKTPFIVLGVALLVMAWVLAGVIGHLGAGQATIVNGVISGAFVWLGFVVTSMAVNYAFQGRPPVLTLIDGGYFLLVLVVMGAIIGAFGV